MDTIINKGRRLPSSNSQERRPSFIREGYCTLHEALHMWMAHTTQSSLLRYGTNPAWKRGSPSELRRHNPNAIDREQHRRVFTTTRRDITTTKQERWCGGDANANNAQKMRERDIWNSGAKRCCLTWWRRLQNLKKKGRLKVFFFWGGEGGGGGDLKMCVETD